MMMKTKPFTALALAAAALLAASGAAQAQAPAPLTAQQQQAFEIYRDIIAIRTARGQAKTPEMVAYLVSRLKAAGFADADITVTDYDSAGERVQGLVVRFPATKPDGRKPIVMLGHMDVVDALAEDWVLPPFTLTETPGWKRLHGGLPDRLFRQPSVRSPATCTACHADAESGLFSPFSIHLPKE